MRALLCEPSCNLLPFFLASSCRRGRYPPFPFSATFSRSTQMPDWPRLDRWVMLLVMRKSPERCCYLKKKESRKYQVNRIEIGGGNCVRQSMSIIIQMELLLPWLALDPKMQVHGCCSKRRVEIIHESKTRGSLYQCRRKKSIDQYIHNNCCLSNVCPQGGR